MEEVQGGEFLQLRAVVCMCAPTREGERDGERVCM